MTAYILIFLAVLCFTGQFAFTKIYEGAIKQTVSTSLVMLTVTGTFGAALYLLIGGFRLQFSAISVLYAAIFALVMIPYYIIGIKALSYGSLAIYGMFMMLGGMLIPFFYGIFILSEDITIGKLLGTVLLTIFIVLQALSKGEDNDEIRENKNVSSRRAFFFLCIIIFVLNGLTGIIAKAHQISERAIDEISFTVISCFLTALFSLLLLCLTRRKEKVGTVLSALKPKPLLIMLLIGGTTHTGNFLHLTAAGDVPASVQFPIVSGGVIALSAIISAFAFKERLTCKEWISVTGAFASTVLFAF